LSGRDFLSNPHEAQVYQGYAKDASIAAEANRLAEALTLQVDRSPLIETARARARCRTTTAPGAGCLGKGGGRQPWALA
jgi:hypothetical protein